MWSYISSHTHTHAVHVHNLTDLLMISSVVPLFLKYYCKTCSDLMLDIYIVNRKDDCNSDIMENEKNISIMGCIKFAAVVIIIRSSVNNNYYCNICRYSRGSGIIWLTNVRCTYSDNSLFGCSHSGFGITSCKHSEDVAISCTRGN